MKFRREEGNFEIKIRNVWHILCCCTNCSTVHAVHPYWDMRDSGLCKVDETIKCCNKPDNHTICEGADNIIDSFVNTQKTKA